MGEPDLLGAAERLARFGTRVLQGHSTPPIFVLEQRQM
jgi:hypothetical protein